MKRTSKILLTIVAVVAAAVCIICCLLIFQYIRGGMLNQEVEELNSAAEETVQLIPVMPTAGPNDPIINPGQSEQTEVKQPDWYVSVNFDALAEINPDIYAWIDIPGTPVSYAVVQSPSNDLFYNNHAVDKSYYSGGSIFTQRYNSKDFQDPVTVLYGHNRTSKTMFAPVNDYAGKDFFDAHPYIYVYTPDTVYRYEIFAAYPHSSEHLLLNYDFSREKTFTSYFDALSNTIDSNYREELFPSVGDRVITLSTCYKSNRMQRYLVQGVLTMEYAIIREVAADGE